MKCPKCGGDSGVTKTSADAGAIVRRWRRCHACGAKFQSIEISVDDIVDGGRDAWATIREEACRRGSTAR